MAEVGTVSLEYRRDVIDEPVGAGPPGDGELGAPSSLAAGLLHLVGRVDQISASDPAPQPAPTR